MQSLQHSPPPLPGLSRTVVWSVVVHGALLAAIAVLEALSPRPLILHDVIQVNLISPKQAPAPAESAPAPEPPKAPPAPENPLWEKLAAAPVPAPAVSNLGDEFKALSELGKKGPKQPEEAPPTPSSDLAEWWRKQAPKAAAVERTAEAPEVKAPEAGMGDAWKKLSESVQQGAPPTAQKDDELSRFWESLTAGGRQTQAQAQGGTPQYLAAVERRISSRWSPPDVFGPKAKATVVVFPILRDGSVGPVRVVASSGSDRFDEAAVRAVLLASPFAPFPEEMRDGRIDVRFTFTLTGVSR